MTVRSASWGVPLLLLAAALLVGIAFAAVAIGPLPSANLLRLVLPLVALALGVLVLFTGHVSYPRVHNLKVYLAGYSVGLQSVLYAVLVGFSSYFTDAVPPVAPGYREVVLLLGILSCYLYTVVKPFPTYRATRMATWVVIGVQLLVLAAIRFFPVPFSFVTQLQSTDLVTVPHLIAATLTVGVIAVNAALTPQSYYLRGSFAGLALLAGGTWLLPSVLTAIGYGPVSTSVVVLLYVGIAPLFLVVAIIAHVLVRMEHRVAYDPLLQIYNREYCNKIISEQSSVSIRPPSAVMMIDIDHFKQVNDTYGHQAGDRILFAVAQAVQKAVVPEGVVCRYGGEELIVVFPGRSGREIVPLAQRLRMEIEKMETTFRRDRIGVTVSLGISDRRTARQPIANVVHAADKALYIAKDNGRNQVRFVRIKEAPRVSR